MSVTLSRTLLTLLMLLSIPALPYTLVGTTAAGQMTHFGNTGFPGSVNITFNSVEGREYGVDITTDIKEWQELTDGLVGEADNTTYTHASPDLAARFLYYRIRQLSAAPPQ